MIEYRRGNVLEDTAEALVNTVNCVGVMGRGVALQFKKAWPANFKAYAAACAREEVQPGRMFVFETVQLTAPQFIINFPTKRHWRGKSRLEDIESGLEALVQVIRSRGIRSIALPPLGAGLGGLEWDEVRTRIGSALADLHEVHVRVYEPNGSPEKSSDQRKVPRMTAGRAALVGLMKRYLAGLLDPSISLLEVHKLMYFMQQAGEPLQLRYKAAAYGPYAENLRHVLQAVNGYFVSGEDFAGDKPEEQLSLVPGAVEEAEAFLAHNADTLRRLERVSDLVEGFESPFGLELLSTVHWVLDHQELPDRLEQIVEATYAWNARKKQFTPRQIGIAVDVLAERGWSKPPLETACR